ncbi:MAG: hypothetical protein GXO50_10155 [Chlorobi bacterium]|nr:hypothetical protein [Chlorobiota bacterium]
MKGLACLQKEEVLKVCNECGKSLVLRSDSPFGSYYSEHPEVQKVSEVLYIAVKSFDECMETKIIKLRQEFKKDDADLRMNYAHITFFNKIIPVIAVHTDNVPEIDNIIKRLAKTGIKPLKKKNANPYMSIVQIRKFVDLNEISKGVYNSHEKFLYYLSIPEKLEWEAFRECVNICRNSHNFPHFDAAQLSLFQYDKIEEFVRIYSQTATKNDLIKMHEEMNKLYPKYI